MSDDRELIRELHRRPYRGPVLAYDLRRVRARIRRLAALGERHDARFLLAVKAFADPRVLAWFAREGVGFDVSNAGELALVAAATPIASERPLSITGPRLAGVVEALAGWRGEVSVSVESMAQLAAVRDALGARVKLALRVDVTPGGARLATRFGGRPTELEALVAAAAPVRPEGLHCHIGSERNDLATYTGIVRELIGFARRARLELRTLNVGGGLHGMTDAQVEDLVARLRALVPADVRLVFEPGGYWFNDAGFALARVIDLKRSEIVVLDLSSECHLRWSTPSLLAAATSAPAARHRPLLFVGPTCYEADVVGRFRVPCDEDGAPALACGDRVVLARVTSYSASWNTGFNGIAPAEVLLHGIDA